MLDMRMERQSMRTIHGRIVIVIVITGCRDLEVDPQRPLHHRALTDTVTRLDKEGCSKPNVFSWIGR